MTEVDPGRAGHGSARLKLDGLEAMHSGILVNETDGSLEVLADSFRYHGWVHGS